jgi:peroxiredoxin
MQMEVAGYFNDTINVFRVQDSIARLAIKNMPPATAEYVIALHLYAAIRILPIDTAADRIAKFKKRWPTSQYNALIDAQFAIVKRLAPGEKAYDFAFTNPQGKTGHLSDFKGKIVLLGFWTSSNRQNIIEMKAAAQMAAKYKDKDIVFLYVSLDEDDVPWIQAIEQHRLSGVHSRENGSWKSFLAQIYGIQSMPTFFLIDREGKFALKQTPMPSQSGFMVQVVDKLLSKE